MAYAKQTEARALVLWWLERRVGAVSEQNRSRIKARSLSQLEDLAEALLDFTALADLEAWLKTVPQQ